MVAVLYAKITILIVVNFKVDRYFVEILVINHYVLAYRCLKICKQTAKWWNSKKKKILELKTAKWFLINSNNFDHVGFLFLAFKFKRFKKN